MPIIEIESEWRETGIVCPFCNSGWMTYSNGKSRPQCGNDKCLKHLPDEYIWHYLITLPEYHPVSKDLADEFFKDEQGGVYLSNERKDAVRHFVKWLNQ